MKKKFFIFFIITVILLSSIFTAYASNLPEKSISLIEKLKMQLKAGSGFAFQIDLHGENPKSPWKWGNYTHDNSLMVEGEYISSEKTKEEELKINFSIEKENILELFFQQIENKTFLTSKNLTKSNAYFQGSWIEALLTYCFLPEELPQGLVNIPLAFKLIDSKNMEGEIASYLTEIDFWLQQYAQEPISEKDQGGFKVVFDIPPTGIKEGIKALLKIFLDKNLNPSTETIESTLIEEFSDKEKFNSFLSVLNTHYEKIIDQIHFEKNLQLVRYYKEFGILEKTVIFLPFSEEIYGFSSLQITYGDDGAMTIFLHGNEGELTFDFSQNNLNDEKVYSGEVSYYPTEKEEKILSFSYTLNIKKEEKSQSGELNENYQVSFLLVPLWSKKGDSSPILSLTQKQQYVFQENLEGKGNILFTSGTSKSNPVSLNGEINLEGLQFSGKIDFQGKSKGPWELEKEKENLIKIESMRDFKRELKEEIKKNFSFLENAEVSPLETLLPTNLPIEENKSEGSKENLQDSQKESQKNPIEEKLPSTEKNTETEIEDEDTIYFK